MAAGGAVGGTCSGRAAELRGTRQPEVTLTLSPAAGAAVPGGRADAGRPAAEVTGGAAQAAGAAAGRTGDRRAGARAQHPHLPAEPGEAQRQEEEGQV